jgi:flavin reductase (NADH)/flavin reductase/chlorophenol-4-monooxygenase component 1
VCSVCDTPPTLLVCINRKSYANGLIKANGVLSVNWLSAEQSNVSQLFAGAGGLSMEQRFAGARWETLTTGAPCCSEALISLDCQLVDSIEIGTHSVLFARVLATVQADACNPLVYCQRAYATTQAMQS